MSLQSLSEDFLYRLLPEGIISLDEQKVIQAVVGGYQDRVDDLRSYTSKLELLVTGQGLPETDGLGMPVANVVIAQIQSPKGKVYSRSLEIQDDTPAATDASLITWVAAQLDLDEEHTLLSAAYGVDMLRLVDANVLPYLAATIGAVLYQTAAQDPANETLDARRLIETWFPRLQFKGTAESFETLGRLLGFDDVRMTPLWSRLSPRLPNDIGSGTNTPDFSEVPDFYPKQTRDVFYDPWVLNDGPYFTWTGTATARFGTNSTDFYTQSVNGLNPFFKVGVVGTNPLDPDPSLSPYILTGGGPETKASVSPSGTGLRFEAISAGSSFNGLAVQVQAWNSGTHRLLTVTDRLSAIKYRSSFYDLMLTMDFDRAVAQFGTNVASANVDLENDPTSANFGEQAVSPYRPWTGGSITQDLTLRDWLTEVSSNGNQTVVVDRHQAGLGDRQMNYTSLMTAGLQVVQAMEEVRPATRHPRSVTAGYLIRDEVGYADYNSFGTVFTTAPGVTSYSGTLVDMPYPPYQVQFEMESSLYGTVASLSSESSPYDTNFMSVRSSDLSMAGTYDYSNATWSFEFPNGFGVTETIKVYAQYEPTSTEVVRDQPAVWPDPTYIAVSGDGGFHSVAQQAVNNIVRGWNPDAYFYTGDNSYYSGLPGEFYWNQAYAQDFIDSKKYFVCYGNHDFYNAANPASGGAGYDLSIETNYYNYLPGNGRYYHVRIGHVELFVVNDGVNSNEDPGFTGNGLMPAEPDGNWCEAPYSPVGTGIKSPTAANAVATVSGVTYTIHTFKSYGDHGDRYYPNYVVYQSGTYTDGQSFVSSGGDALAYGEPCMDPAPSQVVLRQARRYRVIANPGNNYVDYDSVRYYGGDIVQADLVLDDTTATVTGTVRLDRMNSLQAEAIKTWLSESQAPWKVVMYHHPNEHSDQFSSGHTAGSYPRTDWPWSAWGVDVVLNGHVHSYGRYLIDGVTHIIIGIGGQSNKTFKTTAYVSPYAIVEYNKSAISAAAAPTDYGAMHWTATPTKLEAYVQTLTDGVVDTWTLEKPEGVRAYQARPEDDIEDTASDTGDEYPWRRDTVAGGELVDTATYNPSSLDVEVVQVGQTVAVFSHTGAQYDVTVNKPGPEPARFQSQERTLTPYVPGQMAIAFTGTFLSLDSLDPRQKDALPRRTLDQVTLDGLTLKNRGVAHSVDDLDWAMEPGWRLYHFGLVQGVLVADPNKFYGPHHREGLVAWYPFNEHPRDGLTIVDHSGVSDSINQPLLNPDGRLFDSRRGWYLNLASSGTLSSTAPRGITGAISLGFWVRSPGTTARTSIIQIGGLSVDLMASTIIASTSTLYLSRALVSGWNYVALRYDPDATTWSIYSGTTDSAIVFGSSSVTAHTWSQGDAVTIKGSPDSHDIQDLRVWNALKTQAQLELARYHNPTPTAALYRPAYVQAVNDYDRFGIRVMDSGLVTPDLLPSSIETPSLKWVSRYTSTGEYEGQPRFKETGLGSGNTLSAKQQLGLQWNTMMANGTSVVSSWKGGPVAINDAWSFDNYPPMVLKLLETGSTPYGIPDARVSTGTSAPWPNPMQSTNPNRDHVWVVGDDNSIYEVKVARTSAGAGSAVLVAVRAGTVGQEQLTDSPTTLTDTTDGYELRVNAQGEVYAAPYSGTVYSPWWYLYGNDETDLDMSGTDAYTAWVDKSSLGMGQIPPVAALGSNGRIDFEVSQDLPAGNYRLEVTSGNIGQVDSTFDGFWTVITVGDTTIEARLCQGQTGANFETTDTIEFYLPRSLTGSWILSFDWLNATQDTRHGTKRQLKISGVKATRLNTTLYCVSIVGAGSSIAEVGVAGTDYPATPGGWLGVITSWGTLSSYVHESKVYSANDTIQSKQPLSNVMTTSTGERREDVVLTTGYLLPDTTQPVLPVIGPIIVS